MKLEPILSGRKFPLDATRRREVETDVATSFLFVDRHPCKKVGTPGKFPNTTDPSVAGAMTAAISTVNFSQAEKNSCLNRERGRLYQISRSSSS